jgi:ketosteroid isomerase-like protein
LLLISNPDIRQMIEDAIAAFNAHDLDGWMDYYAEDARHFQPNRVEPLRGREEIREDYRKATWVPFPDFHFEISRAFGQENWLCVQGDFTGTNRGPMESPGGEMQPATNRVVRVPICFVVRVENGKLAEVYEYNDQLGFLVQLDLAPM